MRGCAWGVIGGGRLFIALALVIGGAAGLSACPRAWDPGDPITVNITAPSNGSIIAAGSSITCTAAATDWDHWTQGANGDDDVGSFPNGNSGSSVTWQALGTSGVVTITCTADDGDDDGVDPPDTGTRNDEPPGSAHVTVSVWHVIISRCNAQWLPTDGPGMTPITATISPNGVVGVIKFTLYEVSDEPGSCMNAGSYTTTDKDLKFANSQTGFTISENRDEATTTSAVNSATINVYSFDYGAWGKIKAEATVNGVARTAHIYASGVQYATIPRDEDANKIADAWTYNAGANTDDADNSPAGDGTNGDNLTRYEEYRGVLVQGTHTRTNPTQKDCFVYDMSAFGTLGYFSSAGMPSSHRLTGGEIQDGTDRVDFNSETAPGGPVYAQHLYDCGLAVPFFGQTTGPIWSSNSWCRIDRNRLQEQAPPGRFAELQDEVLAHELGHSVLWHQPGTDPDGYPAHGHHWGATDQNCVMYWKIDLARNPYPSTFTEANPPCRTLWKVK